MNATGRCHLHKVQPLAATTHEDSYMSGQQLKGSFCMCGHYTLSAGLTQLFHDAALAAGTHDRTGGRERGVEVGRDQYLRYLEV